MQIRILLAALPIAGAIALAQTPSHHNATRQDFEQYMKDLSNRGRWGKDDQMGAVNLITPAKRKQALATVKEGVSVSLARTADLEPAVDNPQPIVRKMTSTGAGKPTTGPASTLDTFFISYRGYIHTHMDSLCHFLYNDKMYNGFSADEVTETARRRTASSTSGTASSREASSWISRASRASITWSPARAFIPKISTPGRNRRI